MEDYEQIGGRSPRHLNTFSNFFIVVVHYTHVYQHVLCIVAVVDCTYVHYPLQHNLNMPYLVAIDYTHVESATASFKDLVTYTGEHYSRYFGRGSATAPFEKNPTDQTAEST